MILSARDRARLDGVHPHLVRVIEAAAGRTFIRWQVNEGIRTLEAQRAHLAAGRTLTLDSPHIPRSVFLDGAQRTLGHAVDILLLTPAGKANWRFEDYSTLAAEILDAAGMCRIPVRWGGMFRNKQGQRFADGLHFELDREAYPRPRLTA